MSTLMLASASGMKTAAATPGLSATWRKVSLRLVLREGDAGDDLLFHNILLVANQRAGLSGCGIVEGRPHIGLARRAPWPFRPTAPASTLAPSEAISSISSKATLSSRRAFGHDARIGRVDAVHVRIDVAAIRLDGGGDRDRAGVRAAAAERGDAAGRRVDALEAGDHGDLPCARSPRSSSAPSMFAMRAEPWASSVSIGICQPCQERAAMPMSCSTMASRPDVTCSPEATTASYSRAS